MPHPLFFAVTSALFIAPVSASGQGTQAAQSTWSFAVSGDSRNCGDFVMPAIAAKVKAEDDVLYWHLGDFRWMTQPDEDLTAMEYGGNPPAKDAYQQHAWDDFLVHQIASFGSLPVFLGRGNHETVKSHDAPGLHRQVRELPQPPRDRRST
jgi:hypothetical protein